MTTVRKRSKTFAGKLQRSQDPSLLKMISRKAAGTIDAEAYCLSYVEVAED